MLIMVQSLQMLAAFYLVCKYLCIFYVLKYQRLTLIV